MKEKNAQLLLKKYIENNPEQFENRNLAVETKLCKDTSFPFSKVQGHQVEALKKAHSGVLYHKINDMPFIKNNKKMRFTTKKPFDWFVMSNVEAFICIIWYKPRKYKMAHMIPISSFITEQIISTRKSLTIKRSEEISQEVYELS